MCQLIQFLITNHTNLVLLGDFKIHNQDIDNPDSLIYNDTMEDLGLQQCIDKPTHKPGNTLDLIYTESLNRVKVLHSFVGNFISDHRVVGIKLEIKKQLEKHQPSKHRNYKEFNLNNFTWEFNNNRILEQSSLKRCSMSIQWRDGKDSRYNSTTRGKKEAKEKKQAMVH